MTLKDLIEYCKEREIDEECEIQIDIWKNKDCYRKTIKEWTYDILDNKLILEY